MFLGVFTTLTTVFKKMLDFCIFVQFKGFLDSFQIITIFANPIGFEVLRSRTLDNYMSQIIASYLDINRDIRDSS